jgi:hypothetical protein
MSYTEIIEAATAVGTVHPVLPVADWDIVSLLTNGKDLGKVIGGAIVGLIGVILLIVGCVFVGIKLWGNPQNGVTKSWLIIGLMILIGGGMLTGGWSLLENVSSGGQKTIEELGGGMIVTDLFG